MFKHILVPLDGSGMAEAALPAAAFLSAKFGSLVTLVHVIEKNAPREVHGQPHLKNSDEATAYLKDIARRAFPQGVRIDFHVHTAEVDNVAESIVAHAGELDNDAIVMCSHGRGKAFHLLFGSIAEKVISLVSLPVILMRPHGDENNYQFSCNSLLVPLDGDAEHAQALPVSKELAKACGAIIHLAVVIPGFGELSGQRAVTSRFLPGTTSKILEISVWKAEEYIQSQLDELRNQGFEADARVMRGNPAAVIDEAAREFHADLIVMTTHGKSGMDAFWSGSVTHKISVRSSTPLLLIPVKKT